MPHAVSANAVRVSSSAFDAFRDAPTIEHLKGARTFVDQVAREHHAHLAQHEYHERAQELLDCARSAYVETTGLELYPEQDALLAVAADEYVASRWGVR